MLVQYYPRMYQENILHINTLRQNQAPIVYDKQSKIVSLYTKKWSDAADEDFVVIDIETTGLNKVYDRIVEVAAIRYVNGVEFGKFATLVNPQMPIPPDAQAIHGISNAMVRNSPTIEAVLPSLLRFLEGKLLCGHNVNFDIGFLEVCARRLGCSPIWNYIDTISVAKKLVPGLPNYKQKTILDALGYRQSQYHRAEADCRGCAHIMTLALNSLAGQH